MATRNPLNIGAAARAMSNFGFTRLRVVNPYDIAWREARSAVGASDVLARAELCDCLADAVADCTLVVGTTAARQRKPSQPLRPLAAGTRLIRAQLQSGPVALLFGSEKRGLSNVDFSHCHWLLRIPTREEHGSMNLGQAVAVCLYELARGKAASPPAKIKPARAGEVERLTQLLLQILTDSGYLKPGATSSAEEKVRRLVRRLCIPAEDADTWMGMLRQILWKVRSA